MELSKKDTLISIPFYEPKKPASVMRFPGDLDHRDRLSRDDTSETTWNHVYGLSNESRTCH